MRIKRTVTPKVIKANQKRAENSTGANSETGKINSRGNALKLGTTAQKVLPEQDENFRQRIEEQWRRYYKPVGIWEESLIREISFLDARDAILERLEQQETSSLEAEKRDVFGVFNGDLDLPIDQLDLPVQQGWVCDRLRVRVTSTQDSANSSGSRKALSNQGSTLPGFGCSNNQSGNGRSLEIEAELGSSLNRILRYRSMVRRDRYRAVEALHTVQRERREREREEREREREDRQQREKSKDGQNAGSDVQ